MKPSTSASRLSNFELLRVLAIFGIVLHHFVIKGASSVGYITPFNINRDGYIGVLINSFVIPSVNCFILISGWFGISRIHFGILKIIAECAVFGSLSYFAPLLCFDGHFDAKTAIVSASFYGKWFVESYLILILLSPIIERSLASVTKSQLFKWVIMLSIINIGFGYCFGIGNSTGYCAANFIYLYYIGRLLRFYKFQKFISFIGYIAMSSCLCIGFIVIHKFTGLTVTSIKWFGYNSPFVIAQSIFLFSLFTQVAVTSKTINFLAKGVFGLYILHSAQTITPFRDHILHYVFAKNGYLGLSLIAIITCIVGTYTCGHIGKCIEYFCNKIIRRNN